MGCPGGRDRFSRGQADIVRENGSGLVIPQANPRRHRRRSAPDVRGRRATRCDGAAQPHGRSDQEYSWDAAASKTDRVVVHARALNVMERAGAT